MLLVGILKTVMRFLGPFDVWRWLEKTRNSKNGRKCWYWGGGPDPLRPCISQNLSCPKVGFFVLKSKQSKKRSYYIGPRNHPKTAKYVYSKNLAKFRQFFDNFSARWTRIFFWIASLRPWFKCASVEYKEAYVLDTISILTYKRPRLPTSRTA